MAFCLLHWRNKQLKISVNSLLKEISPVHKKGGQNKNGRFANHENTHIKVNETKLNMNLGYEEWKFR